MTQQEVIKILKKSKKPLECKEIAEKLKKSKSSTGSNIKRLLIQNDIKMIKKRRKNLYVPFYYL